MTDIELLELAAKACGYEAEWHPDGSCDLVTQRHIGNVVNHDWSPLTDDGDALRLAVKLRMQLNIGDGGMVTAYAADAVQGPAEDATDDMDYCLRRAIVRAAAEIGRGMK